MAVGAARAIGCRALHSDALGGVAGSFKAGRGRRHHLHWWWRRSRLDAGLPREGEPAALVEAVVGVAAFPVACHRTLARELGNGRGTYASRGVEKGEGGVHFRECRIDLGGGHLWHDSRLPLGGRAQESANQTALGPCGTPGSSACPRNRQCTPTAGRRSYNRGR